MYRDRLDAARRLAEAVGHLKGVKPLVLAIPRGGVPMGRVIADGATHRCAHPSTRPAGS